MLRIVLRAAWLIAVGLTAAATAGGCMSHRGYYDDDDDYECDYRRGDWGPERAVTPPEKR